MATFSLRGLLSRSLPAVLAVVLAFLPAIGTPERLADSGTANGTSVSAAGHAASDANVQPAPSTDISQPRPGPAAEPVADGPAADRAPVLSAQLIAGVGGSRAPPATVA